MKIFGSTLIALSLMLAQEDGTILQVQGKKDDAIKALRDQGIKAVELKGTPFLLPIIEVTGTEKVVEYGEMIQLKASVDKSRLPEHLSTIKYQWMVFEDGKPKKNFLVWPDGTQIFFAAGMKPKKITVLLDVDCLFEVRQTIKALDPAGKPLDGVKVVTADGKTVTEITTELEINSPDPIVKEIQVGTGPTPTPTPDPVVPTPTPTPDPVVPTPDPVVPTPTPTPDFPIGKFNLAKIANDLVLANVSEVERPKRVDLSKSYSQVADKINKSITKQAAGVDLIATDLKLDVQSIMKAIVDSNRIALGESSTAWQRWDRLYGDEIYNLYKNRRISTPKDWETAFRETALGLNPVK